MNKLPKIKQRSISTENMYSAYLPSSRKKSKRVIFHEKMVRDKENITVKSQSTSWTCDQFGVKSIIIFHQLQKIRPVFHLLGNTMTFKKFYSEKIFCFTFSKKYSTYTQLVIIKHLFLLYSFRNKDNTIYSSRSQNPSPLYPLSFGYNTKQVLRHINIQIFSNFNWNWFAESRPLHFSNRVAVLIISFI